MRGCEEILEADRPAGTEARAVLQPHPGLGDDTERSFRPDEQPVRARTRPRAGQSPGLEAAPRRHDHEAFDEVVDMGVERGEMPARAGRYPTAQARVFKALREMAEREPMRPELGFERRPKRAGLDPGGARGPVDLQHASQAAEI